MNLDELPGAELILPGLADLRHGQNNTVGALLVAIACTRLTQAGLVVPRLDQGMPTWPKGAKRPAGSALGRLRRHPQRQRLSARFPTGG